MEWVGVIVRRWDWNWDRDCFVNDEDDKDDDDNNDDEVFVIIVLTLDCCYDTINTFLLTLTMSICNN